MIELQYKLDISQKVFDDAGTVVVQHKMTVETLLEAFFREIHAQRTLNPDLDNLSPEALERQRQYEVGFAAGFDNKLDGETFLSWRS